LKLVCPVEAAVVDILAHHPHHHFDTGIELTTAILYEKFTTYLSLMKL